MKHTLVIGMMLLSLATFSTAAEKKHEQLITAQAEPLGFIKNKSRFLDRVYLKPGVNFSDYPAVQFAELDTSNVSVRQPPSSNHDFNEEWVLTDKDKTSLQKEYLESVNEELIESGKFKAASSGGKTLLVKTTLLEIAPLAVKDDFKSRPIISKIYTEGAGTMTIKIEIYDAQTNTLIGVIGDRADLGNRRLEENNRVTTKRQVSLAFDRWASSLGEALGAK